MKGKEKRQSKTFKKWKKQNKKWCKKKLWKYIIKHKTIDKKWFRQKKVITQNMCKN